MDILIMIAQEGFAALYLLGLWAIAAVGCAFGWVIIRAVCDAIAEDMTGRDRGVF